MKKIEEIKEMVQEAFENMEDLNCDLFGLYNYIRYANEDFGSDMIVNETKPICDNSKVQHYYLVLFIAAAIEQGYKVPKGFLSIYNENKERYTDKLVEREVKLLQQLLSWKNQERY